MTHPFDHAVKIAVAMCLLSTSAMFAQDDPFGTASKDDGKGRKKEIPALSLQRQRENPVIQSLKENPPKTLSEITRGLVLTLQVQRPEEFKSLARRWLELRPKAEELIELHERHGAAIFWEMSREEDFAPQGREIGNAVLDAVASDARDPIKLAAAVPGLFDEATRLSSLKRLTRAGTDGALAILRHAAKVKDPGQHEIIRQSLLTFRQEAVGPCLHTIANNDDAAGVDAALVLGKLNSTEAIPHLVGRSIGAREDEITRAAGEALSFMTSSPPNRAEVTAFLVKRVNEYLAGNLPAEKDADGLVPVWGAEANLESEEKLPLRLPPALATVAAAHSLSRYMPAGENPSLDLLKARISLEWNAYAFRNSVEPFGNIPTVFQSADSIFIEQVLLDAMKHGHYRAARSCCHIFSAKKDASILHRTAGAESPLIEALSCPDQETQFAAVQAIVTLSDGKPYAGSSRVMETLDYLLTAEGKRRVLVAHPRTEEATRIGTLYAGLGFPVETASNGSQLLRLAQQSADVELILLSDTLDRPGVSESLQMLRQDYRCSEIPVAIMVTDPDFDRGAQRAANLDRRTVVVFPPHDEQAVRFNNRLILEKASPYAGQASRRAERTLEVLAIVRTLLEQKDSNNFYDFPRLEAQLKRTSVVSFLAAESMECLGRLGTPGAQSFLVDQATLASRPLAERAKAVEQFVAAVKRDGRQITQAQRLRQLALFQADPLAPETRDLLRRVLDVLELPAVEPEPVQQRP